MAKIVFIGAGSAIFSNKLMNDIMQYPEMKDAQYSLLDIDPERLDVAYKAARKLIEASGVNIKVESFEDRKKALKGADYVINMIKEDKYDRLTFDFSVPRKYEVKQTIGDTVGVAGIFRALRTIPTMHGICRDIENLCPDALLMNYTNPMSMLCLYILKVFKGLKLVGLCHSVQGGSRFLANILNVPHKELRYKAAGINHMAWFIELMHNGEDLLPGLRKLANDEILYNKQPTKFELLKRTGYYVTEGWEHHAEYYPYFMKRDDFIEKYKVTLDAHLLNTLKHMKTFEETKRKVEKGENLELEKSVEYGSSIIHAMETGEVCSINGNVYNNGLITNLPGDSCVEVPCLVDRTGVNPCHVGELPVQLAALNRTHINVHQLTVEAAIKKDKQYLYNAVMMDPNASSVLTLDEIWKMVDELYEVNVDKLGYLK